MYGETTIISWASTWDMCFYCRFSTWVAILRGNLSSFLKYHWVSMHHWFNIYFFEGRVRGRNTTPFNVQITCPDLRNIELIKGNDHGKNNCHHLLDTCHVWGPELCAWSVSSLDSSTSSHLSAHSCFRQISVGCLLCQTPCWVQVPRPLRIGEGTGVSGLGNTPPLERTLLLSVREGPAQSTHMTCFMPQRR